MFALHPESKDRFCWRTLEKTNSGEILLFDREEGTTLLVDSSLHELYELMSAQGDGRRWSPDDLIALLEPSPLQHGDAALHEQEYAELRSSIEQLLSKMIGLGMVE